MTQLIVNHKITGSQSSTTTNICSLSNRESPNYFRIWHRLDSFNHARGYIYIYFTYKSANNFRSWVDEMIKTEQRLKCRVIWNIFRSFWIETKQSLSMFWRKVWEIRQRDLEILLYLMKKDSQYLNLKRFIVIHWEINQRNLLSSLL